MIKAEKIIFGYGGGPVLKEVSLSVGKGEFFTLAGPNGCGKTTFLKLLAGLEKPESGSVQIDGKTAGEYGRRELARKISVLPQNRAVPDITVEMLAGHGRFPYLDLSRRMGAADREAVEAALEEAEVADLRHRNLKQLSGGERQRAYIAMLIAQDTEVLLLDEPVTYLDIGHQFGVMEILRKLNQRGKTVVTVLHDLGLALTYSGKLAVMENGRIREKGTPEEILNSGCLEEVFGVACRRAEQDGLKGYLFAKK